MLNIKSLISKLYETSLHAGQLPNNDETVIVTRGRDDQLDFVEGPEIIFIKIIDGEPMEVAPDAEGGFGAICI